MPEAASDEATLARHAQTDCAAGELLGQALARENMAQAWKRVKANKGSAGVDGRTVQDTGDYLKPAWPDIRARLLDGSYSRAPAGISVASAITTRSRPPRLASYKARSARLTQTSALCPASSVLTPTLTVTRASGSKSA